MRTALGVLLLMHLVFFGVFYVSSGVLFHRDLAFLHLPLKVEAARQVSRGLTPAWNDTASCGMPLLADPSASALYPPIWLLALKSPQRIFTFLLLGHHLLLSLGFFLLARQRLMDPWKSLFASLMVSGSGVVLDLVGFANPLLGMAWLPWMCLAWGNYRATRHARWIPAAGLCFAMAVLAGFDFAPLVFGAILLALVAVEGGWRKDLGPALLVLLLGLLVSAVQWVPTLRYLPHTVRALPKPYAVNEGYYSLHPLRTLELVLPGIHGDVYGPRPWDFWADLISDNSIGLLPSPYLGLTSLLVFLALFRRSRPVLIWTGLGSLALLLAWGRFFPLHPLLQQIPGMSVYRYPEKFLYFVMLFGFFALVEVLKTDSKPRRPVLLVFVLLGPLLLGLNALAGGKFLTAYVSLTSLSPSPEQVQALVAHLWLLAALALVAGLVLISGHGKRSLFLLLSVLLLGDLWGAGRNRTKASPESYLLSGPAENLLKRQGVGRLQYEVYGDIAPPLRLGSLAPLSGTLRGFSYALPNLVDQMEPARLPYGAGPETLAFWGATHLIAAGGKPPWPGLEKIGEYPGFSVYHLQPEGGMKAQRSPQGELSFQLGNSPQPDPSRIQVSFEAPMGVPARVLCAVPALPGWSARIDGGPEMKPDPGVPYLSCRVLPGSRRIEFRYRPPGFILGVGMMLSGLAAMLVWMGLGRARRGATDRGGAAR